MSNVFGIRNADPKQTVSLNDVVGNNSIFVPVPGRAAVAVVQRISRPVDGELFYIRFRGQKLFRRLTRDRGRITIVSRSSRTVLSREEESELEIEGRVSFVIEFPNGMGDGQMSVIDRLCSQVYPTKKGT